MVPQFHRAANHDSALESSSLAVENFRPRVRSRYRLARNAGEALAWPAAYTARSHAANTVPEFRRLLHGRLGNQADLFRHQGAAPDSDVVKRTSQQTCGIRGGPAAHVERGDTGRDGLREPDAGLATSRRDRRQACRPPHPPPRPRVASDRDAYSSCTRSRRGSRTARSGPIAEIVLQIRGQRVQVHLPAALKHVLGADHRRVSPCLRPCWQSAPRPTLSSLAWRWENCPPPRSRLVRGARPRQNAPAQARTNLTR
jgi:hypothetical protein